MVAGIISFCCAVLSLAAVQQANAETTTLGDPTRRRPKVTGSIQGRNAEFLIDSGAAVSVVSEAIFDSVWQNWSIPRLPLPPTLRITGVTGHAINLKDYVELEVEVKGRKCRRPFLVVSGLSHTQAILGYDFIREEGLVIDGAHDSVYYSEKPTAELSWPPQWQELPLTAIRRTTILPRTLQRLEVHALTGECVAQQGTEGLVAAIPGHDLGVIDSLNRIEFGGRTEITVINTSNDAIRIEAGTPVAAIHKLEDDMEIALLDDVCVNSIFGQIGQEPQDPKRGRTHPLSKREEIELKKRLQIQCPQKWKNKYEQLLLTYHDVCSKNKFDLGYADVIQHKIVMKDEIPVHHRQFRVPFEHEEILFRYVDELLKQGAIEVSRSPYNSPIFCVTKKAPPNHEPGEPLPLRCVLDYRAVNAKSLPDRYSIKEVRECVDEVGRHHSKVFTTVDLTAGFWQQALEEQSRQYTAFSVPGKGARYQWRVTPMGLQGSPASFSRLMDYIMREIKGVLTYVDDVLVHTPTHEEHLRQLEEVLLRLRKYGLKLNVNKTIVGANMVQYLGYTLNEEGVAPSTDKLKAVRDFETPKDVKAIREFIGLANYFRFLIPRFAMLAAPLTELTKKDNKWKGGPLPPFAKQCFQKLKDHLCSNPIVVFPDRKRRFILQTDAATGDAERPGGLGAVLLQAQEDGSERVVAYASRALKTHEMNYSAFLLEMAAACYGIDHFDTYLKGRQFTLCTDHRPLEKLGSVHKKTLNRLQQMMLEYDFELRYKEGKENQVADFLSRNVVATITEDRQQLRDMQRQDPQTNKVINFLKEGILPEAKREAIWVRRFAENCFMEDDLIWYKLQTKTRERPVLWAPPPVRTQILQAAHVTIEAGHGGPDRTADRVKQAYYWPGVIHHAQNFVKQCATCQAAKARLPPKAQLTTLPVTTAPNQRVHLDLYGPLRTSNAGNKMILVITDAFSKWTELVAIETKHAEVVARAFFERWICRFTAPITILTDQGREFDNKVMDELCRLWNIDRKRTSPFHPETNAQAERFNRTMTTYLNTTLENTRTLDWEELLPVTMLCYNSHVHQATGDTPFFLTYLHDPRLPYFDIDRPRRFMDDSYVHEAFHVMQIAYRNAAQCMEDANEVKKAYFNKKTEERSFEEGQKVLVYFPNPPPGVNQKFFSRWQKFTVVRMIGGVNVQVIKMGAKRQKPIIVHVNRVIHARDEQTNELTTAVVEANYSSYFGSSADRIPDYIREEDEENNLEPNVRKKRRRDGDSNEEESEDSSDSDDSDYQPLGRWEAIAEWLGANPQRQTRSAGPVIDIPLPNRPLEWK